MTGKTLTAHSALAQELRKLCDRSRLPEGSVIISTEIRKVFDRVCYVVEHDYEYITYRLADGSMRTDHFPLEGDVEPVRCIPGTHATADLLSNLAFNKYGQMTPLYREINRFRNENMRLTRQTLTNWLEKAAKMLEKLLPALKAKALSPGSVVNVDGQLVKIEHICCLAHARAKFKYA